MAKFINEGCLVGVLCSPQVHQYCNVITRSIILFFVGAGAYSGCAYCTQKGEYSKALTKMVYLDHRSLPQGDPLRMDALNFPSKGVCTSPPPSSKTQEFVDQANGQYLSTTNKEARTTLTQRTGCKGSYALRRLPHHDRHINTPVEPMHLVKNISEHNIVSMICGSADSIKVRSEEQLRGRFVSSWPVKEVKLSFLPHLFAI